MKIALIVPGFSAHEKDWCIPALLDYVRVLAQRAEVHVFTLRWPERGGTYPVFGATVYAMNGRQRLGARVFNLWARTVRAMATEHRRASFDAVHAFWADEPGWVGAVASRWLNVRFVLSLAGGELVGLRDIAYGLQLLPGRGSLVRAALRQATHITAGSEYLCALARAQCDSRKLARVPLGVDTTLFSPLSSLAMGEGAEVRVLNVGSLVPVKDHARLIRVFRRVAERCPQAELHIAGDGPLEQELRQLAEGLPVKFLGAVNHGDLPEVYRGVAVFAQTSRHEAQGLAVLEAAACGVPVVGTPVGVLPEIGLVAHDDDELARTLIELLNDPARRKALGETAQKKVAAEYSLAATVEAFMRLYQSVGLIHLPH